MSNPDGSGQTSGENDQPLPQQYHFFEPEFTAEISKKMRVPKQINVDGVSDFPNLSKMDAHWMPAEKLEMHVPEKIIVTGRDGLIGTRSLPREIALENKIMPPDPGIIRVQESWMESHQFQHRFPKKIYFTRQTPPRVLTIDSAYYENDYVPQSQIYKDYYPRSYGDIEPRMEQSTNNNSITLNESNATVAEGMTINEEVVHLRRQLAKLNRRVMSIELDILQRQNREKILYALGLAYFFFKTVLWLSRS